MLPVAQAEPIVRGGAGGVAARGVVYAALVAAVLAGGWLRFNTQIAGVVPALGRAGAAAADQPRGLMELGLVPDGEADALVAGMGLSAGDAALLRAGLRDRQVRLLRLPLVDETPPADGVGALAAGHDIRVSTAGYTRVIRLTRTPVALALPITAGGEVSFSTPDTGGVAIGALGLSGPVRLPDMAPGDVFSVGVVAQ